MSKNTNLLGEYIVNYLSDLKKKFMEGLNLNDDGIWLKYSCTAGEKIADKLRIRVEYCTNENEEEHILTLSTNSLSIVYFEKIIKICKEMMTKELRTKEEAEKEFEKLYNDITGFYLLEFVDFEY